MPQTQTKDPLADLGTPAVAPSAAQDPLSSLGTPAAAEQPQTAAAPTPQPSVSPAAKSSDVPTTGYDWQTPEERLTMPIVKLLIPVHEVLEKATSLTQAGRAEHPILAKIGDLADNIQELLTGGQSAGKPMGTRSGILNNPITQAMSMAPGAAEAAPQVVEDIADAVGAMKKVNPFRAKILAQSQTVANNAFDDAALSAAADSRVAPGIAPSEGGMRPALDTHIQQVAARERALYDRVNAAAGVDMKSLYDRRELLQEALDDPTTTNTDLLQDRLKDVETQINNGEKNARARGMDTEKTLQQAKADTQQRFAVQELKKQVFNNETVVSGNKASGADESVDIDSAIKAVEKLDKPSRFAPQGSPTRLQQALGNDGAANFKQALYEAQKRGVRNAKIAQIAKWAGGVAAAALGLEAVNKVASKVIP